MNETITIDTEQWAVVPRALLEEIVESPACELDARYPACNRSYPSQERKYLAEMEPVVKAREILAAAPRPEAVQSAPLSDSDLVKLIYRAGLTKSRELLYEKSKDGIEVDYPTVEARKLADLLAQQPAPVPVPKCPDCTPAQPEQPAPIPTETMHELLNHVTRELDRVSCPGIFIVVAHNVGCNFINGLTRPAAPDSIATCEWREDEDGIWETACGEAWQCTEGTPAENDMKFCHSCGKHLKEHRYAEPDGGAV